MLHDQRAGYGRCARQPGAYHIMVQRDIKIRGKIPALRERRASTASHSTSALPIPARWKRISPRSGRSALSPALSSISGDNEEITGTGMDVVVAIGKSGKDEITDCIRKMAEDHVHPSDVDEKMLESYLTFKYTPDVVVKSGGDHLTDFLIWQSVYSELVLLGRELEIPAESGFLCGYSGITSRGSAGLGNESYFNLLSYTFSAKSIFYFTRIPIHVGVPFTIFSFTANWFFRVTENVFLSGTGRTR